MTDVVIKAEELVREALHLLSRSSDFLHSRQFDLAKASLSSRITEWLGGYGKEGDDQ